MDKNKSFAKVFSCFNTFYTIYSLLFEIPIKKNKNIEIKICSYVNNDLLTVKAPKKDTNTNII